MGLPRARARVHSLSAGYSGGGHGRNDIGRCGYFLLGRSPPYGSVGIRADVGGLSGDRNATTGFGGADNQAVTNCAFVPGGSRYSVERRGPKPI
jgi:hypothetical protein